MTKKIRSRKALEKAIDLAISNNVPAKSETLRNLLDLREKFPIKFTAAEMRHATRRAPVDRIIKN